MAETLSVIQIMRPARHAFSIERVFEDIRHNLPDGIAAQVWTCPYQSRGIWSRLKGALAARWLRADVLHMTGDAHYLCLLMPATRCILTIHDCEFLQRARGLKRFILWLFWLKLPSLRAVRVVAISKATAIEIQSLVNVDPSKIRIIENPVSNDFQFTPRDPVPAGNRATVLQIGTKANKNIELLAEALSGLDVELRIVGRPSEAQHAALKAADIPYRWEEGLSDSALQQAYRDCDIVAFCSISEGFGLPIVEAQKVGRPVVTSRRAPMDAVAGAGALLADPTDPKDMRCAFASLLASADLWRQTVAAGQDNVARFDARHAGQAYGELYRELANKPLRPDRSHT